MCGIAGFIGTDARLDETRLKRMQEALRHRGPDDGGIRFFESAGEGGGEAPLRVGMAHRRLSILDLSPAGRQPMADAGERHWICYNGEFYNSPDIRTDLSRRGVEFRSTSDTEVLLQLCRRDGVPDAVRRVNGMFAFSHFDAASRVLHLARDRAGQKPLFYVRLPDGSLLYASEIPALLASGLVETDDLDVQAIDQFWTLGYTTGARTFYRAIRRLRPGSLARWQQGQLDISSYWQVSFAPEDAPDKSLDAYADELESLLEDSVRLRLLSDVPVAVCLSGGIDSSLVAAMVSRLRRDVPAYTVSFAGTDHDESAAASAVAAHLGLPHRILDVAGALSPEFARIAGWTGEPFGDASSIPMYFLSREIRRHATVALTGDGGDELFGGYAHYREGLGIWGGMRPIPGARSAGRRWLLRGMGLERGFLRMQRHVNGGLRRKLFTPDALSRIDPAVTLQERRRWIAGAADPAHAPARMQNCDFHTYMTDDVLAKVDRMSMAHGLECRSPFMDHRLIEWAARLPARITLAEDGTGKRVLGHLLGRFLPERLFRRPKQGFTPPWETWCTGEMRETLRKDWRGMADPFMRKEAIDVLAPPDGGGSPVLSWMAYSYATWRRGS